MKLIRPEEEEDRSAGGLGFFKALRGGLGGPMEYRGGGGGGGGMDAAKVEEEERRPPRLRKEEEEVDKSSSFAAAGNSSTGSRKATRLLGLSRAVVVESRRQKDGK